MGSLCAGKQQAQTLPVQLRKVEMPPLEVSLMKHEQKQPFSRLNVGSIVRSLKAESMNHHLSRAQLTRAIVDLKLDQGLVRDPDNIAFKLIKQAKDKETKLYSTKQLVLFGILIGAGSPEEKAQWLFKQYDEDASGTLEEAEVKTMVQDIFDVACNVLPELAVGKGEGLIDPEELELYLSPIKEQKAQVEEAIVAELLLEGKITEAEFMKKTQNAGNKTAQIVYNSGLRNLGRSLK